jgi:hypothetical protein
MFLHGRNRRNTSMRLRASSCASGTHVLLRLKEGSHGFDSVNLSWGKHDFFPRSGLQKKLLVGYMFDIVNHLFDIVNQAFDISNEISTNRIRVRELESTYSVSTHCCFDISNIVVRLSESFFRHREQEQVKNVDAQKSISA